MIVYNNETIKNIIMDALDKNERGIEINEVDRDELIDVILKGDRDFGIKDKDTGKDYTREELQYSVYIHIFENNKCYIGQTSQKPKCRWGSNGSGYEGQVFYNAIKKHGWNNISHIVLCYGLSQEQANEMEVALISIFKSTNRDEFGYNVANGGNGVGQHSEETKKKIGEAKKGEKHHMYGKHHSEETRKKLSEANKGENSYWYGKHPSEETRKKMSEVKKGKHPSEETRKKLSEVNKGENNPFYGKHHSEEARKKMSEAQKGEKHHMYGKHPSEETKKKMSEVKKGKHPSEEARKKMSEAKKGEKHPKAKKVYCNGKIFSTAIECAKFYNVNRMTMNNWLLGKRKTPSEFAEKGLRYATQEDINTYPLYIEEEQNQQD